MQAAEINAGRGDSLLCGPYVISQRLSSPHYAACFAARHVESGRLARLYLVPRPQVAPAAAARSLLQLVEQLAPLRGPTACAIDDAGIRGDGVWAACSAIEGTTAADWVAENGRYPPQAVLQIAREMLVRLADLARLGVAHGDVSAAGLVVQSSGHVSLPMPALRGVVRPSEGYSFNDLPPEAYDYLAPERIADGRGPTIASDVYACGCLWWHLLAGRPPFSGGNSLARLKSAHAAKVVDVRQLAPDVPDVLARAIEICLAREPSDRPQSFDPLQHLLGPATRGGCAKLAECLRHQPRLWQASRSAISTEIDAQNHASSGRRGHGRMFVLSRAVASLARQPRATDPFDGGRKSQPDTAPASRHRACRRAPTANTPIAIPRELTDR